MYLCDEVQDGCDLMLHHKLFELLADCSACVLSAVADPRLTLDANSVHRMEYVFRMLAAPCEKMMTGNLPALFSGVAL